MPFVKPGPNPHREGEPLKVRIPHTHALLAEAGEQVPDTSFWHRRIAHGDVVECDPPKAEPEPAREPPAPAATEGGPA